MISEIKKVLNYLETNNETKIATTTKLLFSSTSEAFINQPYEELKYTHVNKKNNNNKNIIIEKNKCTSLL